jgi:hypothetical protein
MLCIQDHDEVRAQYSIVQQGFNIFLFKYEDGKRYQVTNFELEEVKPGSIGYPSHLTIQEDYAQMLFDDLWSAGLRPKTPDEYNAKDEHINDLRRIVYKVLEIDK